MSLKEAREKAGLTMLELGQAVGVSPTTICRYEQGTRSPKVSTAKKIAVLLGLRWYELVDNKGGD